MTQAQLPGQPHISYRDQVLTIEGVASPELAQRFGTPLFVYSKASMLAALAAYQRGFAGRKAQICYAMKANSPPETMSKPQPAWAKSCRMASDELAFMA